jgi:hypothetical protein
MAEDAPHYIGGTDRFALFRWHLYRWPAIGTPAKVQTQAEQRAYHGGHEQR